ncbi:MAG: hypothetical protein AAF533_15240 [Acidobacteriota bacterium]
MTARLDLLSPLWLTAAVTFVSRRSPWVLPAPVDAASWQAPDEPLARLALGACWRLRALAHSLSHGLSRVPDLAAQRTVLQRTDALLTTSEQFRELAARHDVDDAETRVLARLVGEPLPNALSWAEVAIADRTFGHALDVTLGSLTESSDSELASAASRHVAADLGSTLVEELAATPSHRECLQILIDRWLPPAVHVFGRPGAPGELPLLESRIKSRSAAEGLSAFLDQLEADWLPLGLWLPDAERMGVQAHDGYKPQRPKDSDPRQPR